MLAILVVLAALAALILPNFVRARAQGRLTPCKSNLKNLGTALEMYANDNKGRFPPSLAWLQPNYLKTLPTCPTAQRETYSGSYVWSYTVSGGGGSTSVSKNHYTFFCEGHWHEGVGMAPNYPQYTSRDGLRSP